MASWTIEIVVYRDIDVNYNPLSVVLLGYYT